MMWDEIDTTSAVLCGLTILLIVVLALRGLI